MRAQPREPRAHDVHAHREELGTAAFCAGVNAPAGTGSLTNSDVCDSSIELRLPVMALSGVSVPSASGTM